MNDVFYKKDITVTTDITNKCTISILVDKELTLQSVSDDNTTIITCSPALTIVGITYLLNILGDYLPISYKHNEVIFQYG